MKVFIFLVCSLFSLNSGFLYANPILIGLDADMSSGSGPSGIAIKRGIEIAIDEINADGGVLGRPLGLVIKDHRGNPTRGKDNIVDFAAMDDLVAIVAGLHTPVALQELALVHEFKIPFLVPWAAGTPVVDNNYDPNFVFRVSVRDEYAGGFLIGKALQKGYKQPALMLEKTGWGRSNEKAMKAALADAGMKPVAVSWFHWSVKDFDDQIENLYQAGADVLLVVMNAPEGLSMIRSMALRPADKRIPIISHWGITGGDFAANAGNDLSRVNLSFLQTYSFIKPVRADRASPVIDSYLSKYPDASNVEDIFAPSGTAHAYDLIHLLNLAIKKAGTVDRVAVRDAMEQIEFFPGLLRDYKKPFSPEMHDALDASDFSLARYNADGKIILED